MTFEEIRQEAVKLRADLADDPPLRISNAAEQAQHFRQMAYTAFGLIEELADKLAKIDAAKNAAFSSKVRSFQ